ncbi:Uncharacterized protein Rs2_32900 [Raphanus sativus]|nr:Uncharacterized protein Rs2_32900 [Raphanus sativus]
MSFSSCKSHCRIRFSISFLSTIRCPDKTRVLRELIQLLLANALYQLQIPHLKSSPTIYLECDLLNARRWNFHYKRRSSFPIWRPDVAPPPPSPVAPPGTSDAAANSWESI